jgi:DNA repair protein RecN (Recombination protein N)
LTSLAIRRLAVVDNLELELQPGLTVFTGETGAGKSILVEALGLCLGDRADSTMVRSGADRAEVTAVFDIARQPQVSASLTQRGLDAGGECILRRQILADGGSRAYCNGVPVTAQTLREFGELLVDIHGQNTHQSLLRRHVQRTLLDEFGGLTKLGAEVRAAYSHWHALAAELNGLTEPGAGRDAERDFLSYQIDELRGLVPSPENLAQLELDHRRLAHATQLQRACEESCEALGGDESGLLTRLARVQTRLAGLVQYAQELNQVGELLATAAVQIEEAAHGLRGLRDALDFDPERLSQIERRLTALHDLARKHRVPVPALPERLSALQHRRAELEQSEARTQVLTRQCHEALEAYRDRAALLSAARVRASGGMSRDISGHMQALGMHNGRFEARVVSNPEAEPTEHGADHVEFLVSANIGQELKPLAKVASGGELSRISLAIQVATASQSGVPALVYDEVDAGIGGAVAELVGQRLAQLARHRQVLCITHLPQVACCAQHHFVVGKEVRGHSTRTIASALPPEERVVEVARMLGGIEITPKTLDHARELLSRAS